MDLSAIQAECARLLGDVGNNRWGASVLTLRINIAQTNILGYTNAVKTKQTLTPTANTATVSLDTDTMDIIRVDIKRTNNSWVKLRGYLRDQLDFEDPNWQQRTAGEPIGYWWDGTNQQINLFPVPDTANAITNGLRAWSVVKPADLSSSTDLPFDSNVAMIPYHMAICHWVVAQCFMDDGTPEALAKARFHRSGLMDRPGAFETEIMRITSKFDSPEDIPARIMWAPQGGRASSLGLAAGKSNPLGI